jgi:peptide-methionine (S)-S-oxide reductase
VTQVEPIATFYPAEGYHQDYFNQNPGQPYCMAVIPPKLAKLKAKFAERLDGV